MMFTRGTTVPKTPQKNHPLSNINLTKKIKIFRTDLQFQLKSFILLCCSLDKTLCSKPYLVISHKKMHDGIQPTFYVKDPSSHETNTFRKREAKNKKLTFKLIRRKKL